jgi:hypothetical protein
MKLYHGSYMKITVLCIPRQGNNINRKTYAAHLLFPQWDS